MMMGGSMVLQQGAMGMGGANPQPYDDSRAAAAAAQLAAANAVTQALEMKQSKLICFDL